MNHKPSPLSPSQPRARCPVCGEVSYSVMGVHPQCAMRQADAKRMRRVKIQARSRKKPAPTSELKPWHKRCPRCRAIVHCRKTVCGCGHAFVADKRPDAET